MTVNTSNFIHRFLRVSREKQKEILSLLTDIERFKWDDAHHNKYTVGSLERNWSLKLENLLGESMSNEHTDILNKLQEGK